MALDSERYQGLAGIRHVLRRFVAAREVINREAGITQQQHPAMLAIKTRPAEAMPLKELAEQLLLAHQLKRMLRAWTVVALCAAPAAARAASPAPPLTVSGSWIRAVGGPTPAAAYFTLSNAADKPYVLTGLSSPDCGELMMHQSRTVNGVASMAMVAQRIVPAHGQIVFSPGGYHLMCISPSMAVRPGARIPITLRFADGQRLLVRFPVRPPGG